MPGQIPNIVMVYRIVHIDNIDYLLKHGMYINSSSKADPNYINIGDNTLINQRKNYTVSINPPNGVLGDYVPFYFGPLSPMLLNIKTGYRGITCRPQSEIIYICCKLIDITNNCSEWCFTDGHAKTSITEFYNDVSYLNVISWDIVAERYWNNTKDDYDKMRKKQAELLVKNHVPVNCIYELVVFDYPSKVFVENIIQNLGLNIPVLINPNNQFYY